MIGASSQPITATIQLVAGMLQGFAMDLDAKLSLMEKNRGRDTEEETGGCGW
jgi:hypothetical protein